MSTIRGRRCATLLVLSVAALSAGACGGGSSGSSGNNDGGTGGGTQRTVTGTVTYDFVPATYNPQARSGTLDFAHTTQKPVRGGVVAAMEGNNVLATATTGDDGKYSLTFTPSGAGSLAIVAVAKTTSPSIEVHDNTDQGALWSVGAALDATSTTKDLRATSGWTGTRYDASTRSAAPFAILDSMTTASRALLAVRPSTALPPLVVNWSPSNQPQSGDKTQGFIGTSHFSPAENQIYVLGADGIDTDEYDNHVIVHEWGHFIEANLSRSDSPGGQHGPGDALDPRLAFGEGYGNAMSGMALADPIYADTLWGGQGGTLTAGGFDLENAPSPTDDPTPGPFSEMSVSRLLYDLWDSGSNEGFDQVALGLGPILDVLTGPEKATQALTTVGSFIAGLKRQSGVNAGAVDTLLAHYGIGAITTEWGDGDQNLRAMYQNATLPFHLPNYELGNTSPARFNTWYQNEYFVFTGTGQQVTVTATSAQDVAITLYQQGNVVQRADQNTTGSERLTAPTQSGKTYVVVLTGFGQQPPAYTVNLDITSP